jgi:hypothetical protein
VAKTDSQKTAMAAVLEAAAADILADKVVKLLAAMQAGFLANAEVIILFILLVLVQTQVTINLDLPAVAIAAAELVKMGEYFY